ncbi:hypothetical protein RIF29_40171 [Crotalaria pallida]|uniref:Uncharacterized protein n=1 Tax=Crotalaria pallida TaxID=3830 RepID=A0AAN9E3D8_CROPI
MAVGCRWRVAAKESTLRFRVRHFEVQPALEAEMDLRSKKACFRDSQQSNGRILMHHSSLHLQVLKHMN